MKEGYRLAKEGEFGISEPKLWLKILATCQVISVIPTIIIFLIQENPEILILHFPILMFIFIASVTFGSDVIVKTHKMGR